MLPNCFIDNAKVMAKGQVTIPKDIRNILKVSCGDHITFIVENDSVRIMNSADYSSKFLQPEVKIQSQSI